MVSSSMESLHYTAKLGWNEIFMWLKKFKMVCDIACRISKCNNDFATFQLIIFTESIKVIFRAVDTRTLFV